MNVNVVLPSITKTQYGRNKCEEKINKVKHSPSIRGKQPWLNIIRQCNLPNEKK